MSEIKYDKTNFHKYTFCIFKQVGLNEVENQKPNYKSKSGSSYYFTETGVYRLSNHWGRAANCKWRLQPSQNPGTQRTKLGFARWEQFHSDNDTEKLYFVEVDFENGSVTFNHKSNESKDPAAILRTASETTKRIKQIRNLFDNDSWTQHYPQKNSEAVKKEVITKLIQTEKSIQQIKSEI